MTIHIEEISTPTHGASPLDAQRDIPRLLAGLVEIWNQALGQELALSPQHLQHRFDQIMTGNRLGTVAQATTERGLAGFILLSADLPAPSSPGADSRPRTVHIDGIAVHPAFQRQGIGRALLDWAQRWAQNHTGTQTELLLGSGPMRLLPGLPIATANESTDESVAESTARDTSPTLPAPWPQLGFTSQDPTRFDLACHVAAYTPPAQVLEIPGIVRPFAAGEQNYLVQFLDTLPPIAPHAPLRHFVEQLGTPLDGRVGGRVGGRIADLMGLWTADGLAAVARIIVEDSAGGLEPWFPYTLPKPWAALQLFTPPALAQNLHDSLLDAALRRLHNMGVNSGLMGPVTEAAPYVPFGFQVHRAYLPLRLR